MVECYINIMMYKTMIMIMILDGFGAMNIGMSDKFDIHDLYGFNHHLHG